VVDALASLGVYPSKGATLRLANHGQP